jgi:hypothetical protein
MDNVLITALMAFLAVSIGLIFCSRVPDKVFKRLTPVGIVVIVILVVVATT